MKIPPFEMERWQSLWENRVRYNLSESGVAPFDLAELAELSGADIGSVQLGYGHTEGSPLLRQRIAALYPETSPDDVLVTSGSAEANFIACWTLIDPGDTVVIVTPTYGQTGGIASGLGAVVQELPLLEELDWQLQPGAAAETIRPGTKLVVVTNPNNPTGAILRETLLDEILEAARRVGAWVLVDEVYTGAELADEPTPTARGRSDRVVVTASLSKAYGLPGLRIGWLIADRTSRNEMWARKDYTTITPSVLCDRLAAAALAPRVRDRILARTREILTHQLAFLSGWVREHEPYLRFRPPDAGAIAFVGYDLPLGSARLAERLRAEHSTLLVPGSQFGREHYLRVGFGYS